MRFFLFFFLPLLLVLCSSCNTEKPDEETLVQLAGTSVARETPVEVKIQAVERGAFPLRTISSGILEASRQVVLRSGAGGKITQLQLEEGGRVENGRLVLQLDDREQQLQLQQSELQLQEALVTKQDMIVSNGGQATVDTSVSPQKLEFILIASGYKRAQQAIEEAQFNLTKAQLYAPFAGLVAEVKVRLHQQIAAGEEIAHLIDPSSFEVVFPLLESEAVQVRTGQQLRVRPAALPSLDLPAEVTGVNPVVNEQGLVKVRARLRNPGGHPLFEGMKVEVVLEQPLRDQLIVPKSAVVLRSGREVVFSYDQEEKLAKWNYVHIAHENDSSVAIDEGLEADMLIIYEGNLNLAHDAAVEVVE
ncbi:MAG: efflux RND transporter periplasmic adaptor subunit [Saprospiraceae bacterium]|nr:efflux RND transporter periplasmic adaptor subunit [Lewinella sp.]